MGTLVTGRFPPSLTQTARCPLLGPSVSFPPTQRVPGPGIEKRAGWLSGPLRLSSTLLADAASAIDEGGAHGRRGDECERDEQSVRTAEQEAEGDAQRQHRAV